MKDFRPRLREFIVSNFLFGAEEDAPANDTSFLESGIIDSTGILELILFLDEELGVKVPEDEMIPENLDSLDNLNAYLNTKVPADAV